MPHQLNTAPARYDRTTRLLHWGIAAVMIYVCLAGYSLQFMRDPRVLAFFSVTNMSLATVLTPLMVARYLWRFFRPAVPYGSQLKAHQKGVVHFMHELFYLLIFVVLISGFLMLEHGYNLFGLIVIPQPLENPAVNQFFFGIHRYACMALAAMIVLHISAVIKHQFITGNAILRRML